MIINYFYKITKSIKLPILSMIDIVKLFLRPVSSNWMCPLRPFKLIVFKYFFITRPCNHGVSSSHEATADTPVKLTRGYLIAPSDNNSNAS